MGVMDILARAGRRFAGDGEAVTASFIGPKAKTFDWKKLSEMMRREMDGQDRDTSWLHTRTGRMPSGDLYQEISDNLTRTNFADAIGHASPRQNVWTSVGEVVEGPGILDAYDGRMTPLRIEPSRDGLVPRIPTSRSGVPEEGHYAYLHVPNADIMSPDPVRNATITMSRQAANDVSGRPTIIHELGHRGSIIENFPVGTTPEAIRPRYNLATEAFNDATTLSRAYNYMQKTPGANWEDALDALMIGPKTKQRLMTEMLENGEPDRHALDVMLKQTADNPWRQNPSLRYLANQDETFQRVTAESVDMGDFERAMVPPWERMKMLEWGPQNESDLWVNRLKPFSQADTIRRRAEMDDEIGRTLGDLLRAGAGVGGVAGALSIAKNARRNERNRSTVTA